MRRRHRRKHIRRQLEPLWKLMLKATLVVWGLTSLAGTMRRRGMGAEEIDAALLVTNNTRCDPPLDEDEVRKIASSVFRNRPAVEAAFR